MRSEHNVCIRRRSEKDGEETRNEKKKDGGRGRKRLKPESFTEDGNERGKLGERRGEIEGGTKQNEEEKIRGIRRDEGTKGIKDVCYLSSSSIDRVF